MREDRISAALHENSQITLLVTVIAFSTVQIILNLVFKQDYWMIPVLIIGASACLEVQFSQELPPQTRNMLYGAFLTFEVFYYTVSPNKLIDCIALIVIHIFLMTFTGDSRLVVGSLILGTLGILFAAEGELPDGSESITILFISKVAGQLILMYLSAFFAKRIFKAWSTMEKSYGRKIEEIQAENNRVNDFLVNVSHEIRTPINAVVGLSSVLLMENLPAGLSERIHTILYAGQEIASRIEDILDYTEIEMNKLIVTDETYMINSVINDVLQILKHKDLLNPEIVFDIDPNVPLELIGDSNKLKRILIHLISNSIKFTRDGGVHVRIYSTPRDYGINLIIRITDTGIGMTDSEVDRIYDKFYQSNSGRTRVAGGLGLGIPIVNGFVRSMGGFLDFDSTPGEGTTARVCIPQKVADASPCSSVENSGDCLIAAFISFMSTKNPKVREFYMEMMEHLTSGMSLSFKRIRSRRDLEKLLSSYKITHLFVGSVDYQENREYIDALCEKMMVALILDPSFDITPDRRITMLPKPFLNSELTAFLNRSFSEETARKHETMTCPGISVLVVDDEPVNLLVAKGIFEEYGMLVTTVKSGMEAIEICDRKDFNIIFMDHMMPEMDGVEAMKNIRNNADRSNKTMRIVALTANATSSAREMFISEGFDGFIPKPIELSELERVLKHILPPSDIVYLSDDSSSPDDDGIPSILSDDDLSCLIKEGIDAYAGLTVCLDDRGFYSEMLKRFCETAGEKTVELRHFLERRDWNGCRVCVHTLKTLSAIIGASESRATAASLESILSGSSPETASELLPSLISDFEKLSGLIRKKLYQ